LRAALSVAFGLGLWSASYAGSLLLFGASASVRVAKDVVLAVFGLAAILFHRRSSSAEPAVAGSVPRWVWTLFAAALVLYALVFVEHSIRSPEGGFDAWMVWNLRARFLARAGSDFATAFSPRLLFWTHQDYPWLVPGLVAQGFIIGGTESPLIPAAFAALFGAVSIAVVTSSLMKLRGVAAGILGGLALAATPCFAAFTASQQADVPLSAYVAITVALLALAIENQDRPPGLFFLAGLAAGIGAWTKNEGLLYALCAAVALGLRLREWRAIGWFIAGCVPFLALVAGFRIRLSPPNDFFLFTTPEALAARATDWGRWAELIRLTLRHVFYFQDFGLWIAAEVALLLGVVAKMRPDGATPVLGTTLLLGVAGLGIVYVLQPHPLDWILWLSASRVFVQIWPAVIVATLLAVVTSRFPVARTG
jgi:hypothetical protein